MKTLFLSSSLASMALCSPLSAQASDLAHALSHIDQNATHLQIHNMKGEMDTLMEYLELAITVAKNNGERVPEKLSVNQVMADLGLGNISAFVQSSDFKGTHWVNKSYLQTGANNKGVFSLLGEEAMPFDVTDFAPAGTDIAVQFRLDLRQVEDMAMKLSTAFNEEKKAKLGFAMPVPKLGMSASHMFSKMNISASLVIDFNEGGDKVPMGPMMVDRPDIALKIDGMNWMWPLIEPRMMVGSKLPFNKEKQGNITRYTLDDAVRDHLQGFSPAVYVDEAKQQIWMVSDRTFLDVCLAPSNPLSKSSAFQKAWTGLPAEGNAMAYFSKEFLGRISKQYETMAKSDVVDQEFINARPLLDRIVNDLTKSERGFAGVISKDNQGIIYSETSMMSGPAKQMMLQMMMMRKK